MAGQRFLGTVIGTAMQKTCKVCVKRICTYYKTGQQTRVKKNYLVHDENEEAVIGDLVAIESCRPISKMKSFRLAGIVRPARRYVHPETGQVYTSS